MYVQLMWLMTFGWGRDSLVDIATNYGLDGPGIESRPAPGPSQPPTQWVPGVYQR
jgi:hypothetical protein